MKPQATALAITCLIGFAFNNLAERFIRLVLEEFALLGNPTEKAIGHQLPARVGLTGERPQRMVEYAMPVEDNLEIDL
jgi:hypothetical protein